MGIGFEDAIKLKALFTPRNTQILSIVIDEVLKDKGNLWESISGRFVNGAAVLPEVKSMLAKVKAVADNSRGKK